MHVALKKEKSGQRLRYDQQRVQERGKREEDNARKGKLIKRKFRISAPSTKGRIVRDGRRGGK